MTTESKKIPPRIVNPNGRMPRGLSNFAEAITQGCCLVDKSRLVREVLDCHDKVSLITRPRRFGKTTNMGMLHTFFEHPAEGVNTKMLFDGLLVADDNDTMKHQGNYPVISLSLKSAKMPTWEEAYNELCSLICQEIDRHPQAAEFAIDGFGNEDRRIWQRLLNRTEATRNDWRRSLQLLCKLLSLHHNKENPDRLRWTHPIVLIDEYDAPIHAAYTNSLADGEDLSDKKSYYGRMAGFIRSLLGNALKGNSYLHKAVLTGIFRVAKEDIFSGLNNPGIYSVLNYRFSSSFGFTPNEVEKLLQQRGLKNRLDEVRAWYDGYCFGRQTIYNPWSVVSYLANADEGPRLYWVNTSDNAVVHTMLRGADADTKNDLLTLLLPPASRQSGPNDKKTCIVRPIAEELPLRLLTGTSNELWALLLAAGYATAEKTERDLLEGGPQMAHLRLPNLEVKSLYKSLIESWFAQAPRREQTTDMVKALLDGDGEDFAKQLQQFVHESLSYFDVSQKDPERVYQAFVLGLLVRLEHDYRLRSEREAGSGRADVLLIPKQPGKPGIILEFKRAGSEADQEKLHKAAQAGLQQIKDKNYAAAFSGCSCSFILAVAVAFSRKNLAAASEKVA